VISLLNWTGQHFARHGLDSPRLSAEILLSHCLNCDRLELYTRHDYRPDERQLDSFRKLVQRATHNEPIAYLVGHKEFYSLSFTVTPDVLIPRSETEALVDESVTHLRGLARKTWMWDVCTGSGCVAIAAATQVDHVRVLATDISAKALDLAGANARSHGVSDRIIFAKADLLSLPDDLAYRGPFDVIAANPPYVAVGDPVAEQVAYEPEQALMAGADGLDFIRPLVASAGDFLAVGGLLAMEFGQGQADQVRDIIVSTGRFAEPRILRDHQNIERIALAKIVH